MQQVVAGDVAWVLVSTILMLLMTVPELRVVLRRHGAEKERARTPRRKFDPL